MGIGQRNPLLPDALVTEYPGNHEPSDIHGRAYPMPTKEAERIMEQYEELWKKSYASRNYHRAGRLGMYQSINMDQAMDHGISVAEEILSH